MFYCLEVRLDRFSIENIGLNGQTANKFKTFFTKILLVILSFAVAGRWVREVRDDTANRVRSGVRGHVPSGSRAMTVAARSTLRSSDARGTWHEARGTWHGAVARSGRYGGKTEKEKQMEREREKDN